MLRGPAAVMVVGLFVWMYVMSEVLIQVFVIFLLMLMALVLVGSLIRSTKHNAGGWTHTLRGSTWQQDPEKIKNFREYRRKLENEGKVFSYTDGVRGIRSNLTRDEKIAALKKSMK